MKKDIKLTYLKKATKFLDKNSSKITETEIDNLVIKFIKNKLFNIDINIDYKPLRGSFNNLFRIRKGNIRIIVTLTNNEVIIEAIIEDIGFRGDIYK